ncbi:MAG: HIT family protein [bacterium]|nr:HIT family protein [bacterium]
MASIFTKIIQGEIPCHKIWEDDQFFAFLDIRPVQPGMTLIVPKKEVDSPFDMADDEYCNFLLSAKKLIEPIRRATGCAKVALVIEGLDVPHAHIKLIPISKPHDLNAMSPNASDEELSKMAEKIRAEIHTK